MIASWYASGSLRCYQRLPGMMWKLDLNHYLLLVFEFSWSNHFLEHRLQKQFLLSCIPGRWPACDLWPGQVDSWFCKWLLPGSLQAWGVDPKRWCSCIMCPWLGNYRPLPASMKWCDFLFYFILWSTKVWWLGYYSTYFFGGAYQMRKGTKPWPGHAGSKGGN